MQDNAVYIVLTAKAQHFRIVFTVIQIKTNETFLVLDHFQIRRFSVYYKYVKSGIIFFKYSPGIGHKIMVHAQMQYFSATTVGGHVRFFVFPFLSHSHNTISG